MKEWFYTCPTLSLHGPLPYISSPPLLPPQIAWALGKLGCHPNRGRAETLEERTGRLLGLLGLLGQLGRLRLLGLLRLLA